MASSPHIFSSDFETCDSATLETGNSAHSRLSPASDFGILSSDVDLSPQHDFRDFGRMFPSDPRALHLNPVSGFSGTSVRDLD
jgi:hypothetical protein